MAQTKIKMRRLKETATGQTISQLATELQAARSKLASR
jgi:hypothetical protein